MDVGWMERRHVEVAPIRDVVSGLGLSLSESLGKRKRLLDEVAFKLEGADLSHV